MGNDLVKFLGDRGDEVWVTSRKNREYKEKNIHLIHGNAHDKLFLKVILQERYNAIVDFMSYSSNEFSARLEMLLDATEQYCYLSSARVYAASDLPLTEDSLRLLDIRGKEFEDYLRTDEYALAKARQENMLRQSGRNNWTIIRPYITYSNIRLQLGIFEKELWLYRALNGHTVVFPNDIGEKYTTMTYGADVARGIVMLVGNNRALGETVQIVAPQPVKWKEILKIYIEGIESYIGQRPKIKFIDSSDIIGKVTGRKYQILYDRLYDRYFNSQKINQICGEELSYIPVDEGLKRCMKEFIMGGQTFRLNDISWKYEGFADGLTGEKFSLELISTVKGKIKYESGRYIAHAEFKKEKRAK